MTTTAVLETAAGVAGVALGMSPLFQVQRMHRRGSAADVSLASVGIVVGAMVWLAYGVSLASMPLIATNSTAVLCGGTCFITAVRLRPSVPESNQSCV